MNTEQRRTIPTTPLIAGLAAVLCTAAQLAGVAALAEREVTASQMVQLERVVVTGKRVAAVAPTLQVAAACDTQQIC